MPQLAPDQIRDFHFVVPSDDLDAKLNAANDGDIFILGEGTYTLSAQVDLSGRSDVTIWGSGRGTVINVTYAANAAILLDNSTRITIGNFYVSSSIDQEFIRLSGVSSVDTLIDNIFYGRTAGTSTGYFVEVVPTSGTLRNFTLVNCKTAVNGAAKSFFYMNLTGTATIADMFIMNNEIRSNGTGVDSAISVLRSPGVSLAGVLVANNRIEGSYGGILINNCEKSVIIGNVMTNLGVNGGIFNNNTNEVVIANNVVSTTTGLTNSNGIYLSSCENNTVIGNVLQEIGDYGIRLNIGYNNVIANNTIDTTSSGEGIYATTELRSVIASNTLFQAGLDGISLDANSDFCVLTGNWVELANDIGYNIAGANVLISGCYAYDCGGDAADHGFSISGDDCLLSGCYSYLSEGDGFNVTGVRCNLSGCYAHDSVVNGFTIGATQVNVAGCYAYSSNGDGFTSTSQRATFVGCIAEANTGVGIEANERYTLIASCYARANSGGGFAVTTNAQSTMIVASYAYINTGAGFTGIADNSGLYSCQSRQNTGNGFNGSWDVVVSCYSIQDGDAGGESGFVLSGSLATVSGCHATLSFDHGFNLTGAGMNVTGCYATRCGNASGDYGFTVTGNNCNLTGCYSDDNYDHNINVNGNECSIDSCYSRDAGVTSAVTSARGISSTGNSKCKITNCYVDNSNDHGILSTGTQALIANCYVNDAGSASGDYGIDVTGTETVVSGCYVFNSNDYGYYVTGSECQLVGCYQHTTIQSGASSFYIDSADVFVVGCMSNFSNGDGFQCGVSAVRTAFSACMHWDSAAYGFNAGNAANVNTAFIGCYSYSAADVGYRVNGPNSFISGCYSHDDGNAATDYAFHVDASAVDTVVEGCYADNSYDDSYYIDAARVKVHGCYSMNAGQTLPVAAAGIRGTANSASLHVDGCTVYNSEDHGILSVAANSIIAGCHVHDCGSAAGDNGIQTGGDASLVVGCYVDNSFDVGIYSYGARVLVAGCYVYSAGSATGDYGIQLGGTDAKAFACYVYDSYDAGIYVGDNRACVVGCHITDAGQTSADVTAHGIHIAGGWCGVLACYVENSQVDGIHVTGSYCNIASCYVSRPEGDGIALIGSNYTLTSSNYCYDSNDDGIYLDGCTTCLVSNNFLADNDSYGIQEDSDCSNNDYEGNKFYNNATGEANLQSTTYSWDHQKQQATVTPTGTTQTIDWEDGTSAIIDLNSATGDVTLSLSNPKQGQSYLIKFIQGSVSRDVVLPSTVLVPGGTAPTTLNITEVNDAEDVLTLYWDGTSYYGNFTQNYG